MCYYLPVVKDGWYVVTPHFQYGILHTYTSWDASGLGISVIFVVQNER